MDRFNDFASVGFTCEHALIHNARSTDEHGITGHDGAFSWDHNDVARNQVCGHRLLHICPHKRLLTHMLKIWKLQ